MDEKTKKKVIDVDFEELDDRDYFTIEETAKKLSLDVGTIIYWCNKFEDILKTNSIGQFKIFSKEDIRNLKTIKELNVDKGLSVNQIKEYLNQHSTAIVVKKDKELDLSIFNFFTNIINTQNKKIDQLMETQNKALKVFSQVYNEITIDSMEKTKLLNKIVEEQSNQKLLQESHQAELKDYVTTTITETIDNSLDKKLANLTTQFKSHIDERELEYQRKDQERIDYLNKKMEEQRQQYLKEQEEKEKSKGIFGRLFGK